MNKHIRLGIIGSGNAAWCLGHAFHDAGVVITEVVSRNSSSGIKLARNLNSEFNSPGSANGTGDIYLLCVQDRYLTEISSSIPFKPELLLHCSGSVPLNAISGGKNHGVLYPVINMLAEVKNDFSKVPFCIESDSAAGVKRIRELCATISQKIVVMNSGQRQQLHLAAVFVNNFTNACLSAAKQLSEKENISFDLLKPLMYQTVQRVDETGPLGSQTGPARRNDAVILKKHISLLKDLPHHKKIYKVLSDYILSLYPET
jgi:predicted short-subunit dehydrogenase-like oxidoreductase (DUF2520 family)